MSLSLFVARRIYARQDGARRRVSRPAVRVATAGVAVGIAVMIVTVGVVLGFKHTIRDKVAGIGGHITVAEFLTLQANEHQPIQIGDEMMARLQQVPGAQRVQRYAVKQGILKTDDDFLGVAFKGVAQEYDTTFIHANLTAGSIPHFSDSVSSNKILISKSIADRLQLSCGERVFAYFIDESGVRTRRFTIEGIYATNMSQYDDVICFADLYTTVRLNAWEPDQVSGAELYLNRVDDIERATDYIVDNVNRTTDAYGGTYTSKTMREQNEQIFSWLDLLDMNVWIILCVMMAVAAVTITSGLLILILERTTMIGLMKSLGARTATIRHVFLWLASFIVCKGMALGNVVALALLLVQHCTGAVQLDAATYYVSAVPVEIDIPALIALDAVVLLLCIAALVVPSLFVARINPARSLRFE